VKTLPKSCHLCEAPAPDPLPADWIKGSWRNWVVCAGCIRSGRAIPGDRAQQEFSLGGPVEAFWDQTRYCATCSKDYLFTAEEQRLWYETLKFPFHSVPIQCTECRRGTRARKRAQATLQQLLPLPKRPSWQLLEKVALAAAEFGAGNALNYLRRAKNRCDDPCERARLEADIAAFVPAPPVTISGNHERLEQFRAYCKVDFALSFLSDEDRASALLAPGLSKERCRLVARISGIWVRPEPDLQDRCQLAYLDGEHICPNMPPHKPKVLIDRESGVLLYMPRSGTRGQTGHYRQGNEIYGPPGVLPWV